MNDKSPKYKEGQQVRISKYKSPFAKSYLGNFTTELFTIDKVLSTVPWTYKIVDYKGEPILGSFYAEQLSLYNKQDDHWEVEEILKRRTKNGVKEVLIKFRGYNDAMWLPESNLNN